MKRTYETPDYEFIVLFREDIITASTDVDIDPAFPDDGVDLPMQ